MARVVITELVEGQAATESSLNATLISWNTQSAAVDAVNFRLQGIGSRNIAQGEIHPSDATARLRFRNDGGTYVTVATNVAGAWLPVDIVGGTPDVGVVQLGPLRRNNTNGQQMMLHASCRIQGGNDGSAAPNPYPTPTLRLAYAVNAGGPWTGLGFTRRQFGEVDFGAVWQDSYTVAHLFQRGDVGDAQDFWVRLELNPALNAADQTTNPRTVMVDRPYLFSALKGA